MGCSMRRMNGLWRLVAVTAVLCAGMPAQGQRGISRPALNPRGVDGMAMGAPVNLGSEWLARQGDDPEWAQPGYNDGGWMVVNTNVAPVQQGMKHVDAIWYRTHVRIPAGEHNLALMLTEMEGSNEVFVNGQRLGEWGRFAPGGENRAMETWTAAIPDAVVRSGEVTVAIRTRAGLISHWGDFPQAGVGLFTEALLGPAEVIDSRARLLAFRNFTSNWSNLTLVTLVLLITVALALTVRGEPEYKVLALALAAEACAQARDLWQLQTGVAEGFRMRVLQTGFGIVETIAIIEFVRLVLGLRRSRWFTGYYWVAGTTVMAANLFLNQYWFPRHALDSPVTAAVALAAQLIMVPATMGLPLLALWVAWRKRNGDALLLSVPLLIQASLDYYSFGAQMLYLMHVVGLNALIAAQQTPLRAFNVGWNEVASFAFSVTMMVFLVVRTIRLARARARAASEMQAVKTLQELLLARAQQATPGYRVDTVYRPAAEVGGDFFLVSPGPDGSIVAIVGDVSGKGLLAAMRVSLILGALNRESSRRPEEILTRLNQVLLGQGDVGFTTACCVRVEANGDFSFANAGHLNPYVDGREVEAPGALPLGIRADQSYVSVEGHLEPEQRMVLLSDGVPEARAKRRLLGFEKLVELTRLGAAEIADAAQAFGQEDDITVLALALA